MSEAKEIVLSLGGEWRTNSGLAPCPICQSDGRRDQRALSVSSSGERTLISCHKSGCAARDIFSELRARGLTQKGSVGTPKRSKSEMERELVLLQERTAKTQRYCDSIFKQAISICSTPAEVYLKQRGIPVQGSKLRNTIRFHPNLRHNPSGQVLPCMVARIRDAQGQPMGIHRTYLKPDGSRKADVQSPKMMLGRSSGGAVRLGPDRPVIALAEGIETALSIGFASRMTVWACLSTSGLKGLILPQMPLAELVVIAADHDPVGLAAAEETARRLEAEGRSVSIIAPRAEGSDFNDVLRS